MKKYILIIALLATALSCAKKAPVQVTASFTTDKDVYQVGEELIIKNHSTVQNNILAFCKWEFGNTGDYRKVYTIDVEGITFDKPGMYNIILTAYAEQGAGSDTYTKQVYVIDENDIPFADFTYPKVIRKGVEVPFEDQSTDKVGGITTWLWIIDGVPYPYRSPSVTFPTAQNGVEVSLTVTDAFGASDTKTVLIDVIE